MLPKYVSSAIVNDKGRVFNRSASRTLQKRLSVVQSTMRHANATECLVKSRLTDLCRSVINNFNPLDANLAGTDNEILQWNCDTVGGFDSTVR